MIVLVLTAKLWGCEAEPDRSAQPGSRHLAWLPCAAKFLPGELSCAALPCQQGSSCTSSCSSIFQDEVPELCCSSSPGVPGYASPTSHSSAAAPWSWAGLSGAAPLCVGYSALGWGEQETGEWGQVGFGFCSGTCWGV